MKINLVEMYVDENIRKAVQNVLDSGVYVKGENNKKFEKEFASFCNVKYGVTTSSGTSAIYLALKSINVGRGDEVIVPSYTFIASVTPIIHLGGVPVFVDIDPETYTMNTNDVKRKITDRTKVIIPVHLYGHPVDMDPIMDMAKEYDLRVVEDCCQAHGALYKGKNVGSIGDIGCFSFYPSKNMTVAGDGGMVVTNNMSFTEEIRMLRDQGMREKYVHEIVGFNFRLSEIHAAIGREQLKHLPKWIETRREIAKNYNDLLHNIEELILPIEKVWAKHVYHLYTIRAENRDGLIDYLNKMGIDTGIYYPIPVHRQPAITKLIKPATMLKETEECTKTVLSIPVHSKLKDKSVNFTGEKIIEFYKMRR